MDTPLDHHLPHARPGFPSESVNHICEKDSCTNKREASSCKVSPVNSFLICGLTTSGVYPILSLPLKSRLTGGWFSERVRQ